MRSQTVILSDNQLSDEDILELNSAHFSLRMALIFLIVIVIFFAIMQLIKLAYQIMKIRNNANKPFDSQMSEVIVDSKKAKRRKRSKHSLPSKEMKIQLSLTNEQERDIKSDDRDIADKKEGTKKTEFSSPQNEELKIVPRNELQKSSDELPAPNIKDSLPCFGSQNISSITSVPIKEKSTLSVSKAQDSLMVVNNEISLQPSHSAERLKREAESEQKKSFLAAKAQDSLMVVNDQKPLQPAASAEQSNLETTSKSEESKTAQQKNN